MKLKYIATSAIMLSILFLVVIFFFLFSIKKVSNIYVDKSQDTIIQLKKDFIKDTVNNMIAGIDSEKKAKIEHMDSLVANTATLIYTKASTKNLEFKDFIIQFFQADISYDSWTVLIWSDKDNKAIYDTQNISGASWEVTLNNIRSTLSSYRIVKYKDEKVVFGISKTYIDELVKNEISDTIRNLKFGDESYIWVNEILNYQGGKNFAIRRIHPNLPETEGTYLSTDMTDVKGNLPYLTELQGINKSGELYFTYFFKEFSNDVVSEKLAYAKLYKDFNWVIAMGVYQKDIQAYIDHTNTESEALVSKYTLILVFLLIIILFFIYLIIILIEKIYYRHSKKLLESEVNQDPLTKSGSRRNGIKELIRAFKDYKRTGSSPGIIMFDVDNFKSINDTYGHAAGDLILAEIVKAIYDVVRSSDRVIRWGGDEFIVICYGLPKTNAIGFGNKILSVVAATKIPIENQEISATLSIGFSYFNEADTDYTNVLDRADQALYKSKSKGRNQVNLFL